MAEPMEIGTSSFVEELKHRLDHEMPPDVVERFVFLLRDKLGHLLIGCNVSDVMPSAAVTCLEKNIKRSKVVMILLNVLGNLDFHGQMGLFNFTRWIKDYQALSEENDQFVGRQDDVDKVFKAMCSSDFRGVWIYGFGGLGKTTLATEVCYRAKRNKGVCFIILDLKQTVTLAEMFRAIVSNFGIVSSETELNELERITVNALKEKQKETWLLLDNIEHIYNNYAESINVFLKLLVSKDIQQVKILVTSRDELHADKNLTRHFYQHKLRPLDDDSSLQFLRIYSKPTVLRESDYRRAIEHCGNIPLALLLMANTIRSLPEPSHFNPNVFIRDSERMYKCIDYAFNRLSSDLQELLVQLTVFERARFDVVAVAHVLKLTIGKTLEHLVQICCSDMLQTSWMSESPQPGYSYQFHEMILSYLKNKRALLPPSVWNGVEQRFSTWMFKVFKRCYDDYYESSTEITKYIQENAQIVRAFFNTLSQDVMKSASLPECEHMYLAAAVLRSSDTDKSDLIESMKRICIENLTCIFFWKIQEIAYCVDIGCKNDALRLILAIENDGTIESLSEHDKTIIRTDLLVQKGRLFRMQNDTVKASEVFKEALGLLYNLDPNEKRVVMKTANVYNSLGNVAHGERDYDTSLKYHERAIELVKPLVGNNPNHELTMFKFNVGTIALAKARQLRDISPGYEDKIETYMIMSLQQFDESIEEHVRLGLNHNEAFADKLHIRSKARLEAKQFDGALSDALECQKLRETLFEGHNTKKLFSHYHIGNIYIKKREYVGVGTEESRNLIQKAISCFNKVAGFIQDGVLTKDSPEMPSFLHDYKRLAETTRNEKFIQYVTKFCVRVAAGEDPNSSSDSRSSSSEEESDSPESVAGNNRKDSGVIDDSSDVDLSIEEHNELNHSNRFFHPLGRMLSDDAFVSPGDEYESFENTGMETTKRKRDSESD